MTPEAIAYCEQNGIAFRVWVAGISIGAINSALIAGNPPERRVGRLRAFWEGITTGFTWFEWANMPKGDAAWKLLNQLYAGFALVAGAPDSLRHDIHRPGSILPATQMPPASTTQADSGPRSKRHVDFDRLKAGTTRLSVGAVNVRSGNFVYFDTKTHTIGPEHIMASGALPLARRHPLTVAISDRSRSPQSPASPSRCGCPRRTGHVASTPLRYRIAHGSITHAARLPSMSPLSR